MAERRPPPADAELGAALTDLGARLAFPPTPDLATAVRRRLVQQPTLRRFVSLSDLSPRRAVALAALTLALLAAVMIGLVPGARSTVAEWLGLRGVKIDYAPAAPSPTPPGSGQVPTPRGLRALLGRPLTLDAARAQAGFPVRLPGPPELAAPDEVYIGGPGSGGEVTLLYHTRPGLPAAGDDTGLLITQFRGESEPFYGKLVGPGTRLQEVSVNGRRGFWIEGQPHTLLYRDSRGQIREERSRLAGNTLLWERDGVTYRIESALDRGAVLRIAESMQ